MTSPLIQLRNVSLRPLRSAGSSLSKLARSEAELHQLRVLPGTNWDIHSKQHWLIVGPNGSGKSTLVSALCGKSHVVEGKIQFHSGLTQNDIGYVSSKSDSKLVDLVRKVQESPTGWNQLRNEDLYVEKYIFSGTKPTELQLEILKTIGLLPLMSHHLSILSTGQLRKLSIAQMLMKMPKFAILDEPFDGLDNDSRKNLCQFLCQIQGIQMILISHRLDDVENLPIITHVMRLGKENTILAQGSKDEVLSSEMKSSLDHTATVVEPRQHPTLLRDTVRRQLPPADRTKNVPLVEMKNVQVEFEKMPILKDLSWSIHESQHWAVVAPNGSGKSTLLELISGECAQVHSNDIRFWGLPREQMSLLQVREKLGVVTSKIQTAFGHTHQTVLRTLCTSYHGIVGGVCPPCTEEQVENAKKWAKVFEIEHLLHRTFTELSQGQQRIVICARAFVTEPELILLDEPFHGLDAKKRHLLLDILKQMQTTTTFVIISHHRDEIPDFVHKMLFLDQSGHCKIVSIPP